MKYLGIDYGSRRIGIAISDPGGTLAFPKETIPNDATSVDRIAKLVRENEIGEMVIGDTRAMNGQDNPITVEATAFMKSLSAFVRIPLHEEGEAWSTVEASRFAPKGRERDDSAAAAIILQRFLDSHPKSE